MSRVLNLGNVVGPEGPVFTPSVDTDGNLSWTNNGGLPNPSAINIKGPRGDVVEAGAAPTFRIDENGHLIASYNNA